MLTRRMATSTLFAAAIAVLLLLTARATQASPCAFSLAWPFCIAGAAVNTAATIATSPLYAVAPPYRYYRRRAYYHPPRRLVRHHVAARVTNPKTASPRLANTEPAGPLPANTPPANPLLAITQPGNGQPANPEAADPQAIQPLSCRAARALLGWSQDRLVTASGITKKTIADFERGAVSPHAATLGAIRAAFESAGIEFLPHNGVVLREQHG